MAAKSPAAKPARKGTARTSNGPASPVKTKRASAAVKAGAPAKLGKPKPKPSARRAPAKPAAKPVAKPEVRREVIEKIVKLRAAGKKWGAISEETGMTLSALARVRATAKRDGIWL